MSYREGEEKMKRERENEKREGVCDLEERKGKEREMSQVGRKVTSMGGGQGGWCGGDGDGEGEDDDDVSVVMVLEREIYGGGGRRNR